MKASIAERIQAALLQESLSGWLICSFRGGNPIAEHTLQRDHARLAMRRNFYFAAAVGEPTKLVHEIESELLEVLPGKRNVCLPWQQLHSHLPNSLAGSRRVAVQYSPLHAIRYISPVDAGMVEPVRSFGVVVISSTESNRPIVAVNSRSAGQHYPRNRAHIRSISEGKFPLIDFRTRKRVAHSDCDDIAWTRYIGRSVPDNHEAVFQDEKNGRNAAIRFVQ